MSTNTTPDAATAAPAEPESVIPKLFNPEEFQWWSRQHGALQLDKMSKGDLQQALCQAMTSLERIEGRQAVMAELFEEWRQGVVKPDADDETDTLAQG